MRLCQYECWKTAVHYTLVIFTQARWQVAGPLQLHYLGSGQSICPMCQHVYLPVFVDNLHGRQQMAPCSSGGLAAVRHAHEPHQYTGTHGAFQAGMVYTDLTTRV